MNDEVQGAIPAPADDAEQVQQVETTSSEATAEQAAEQQTEHQEPEQKKEPWFQKRIGELTREKYEARRAAEQYQAELQQYREQLARLQQGEAAPQMPDAPHVDVESLVEQRAAAKLAEQRFNESCNKAYEAGTKEFPDFDRAVSNLRMLGANREFLELVVESDAGHKLLHRLGNDMDEAARILRLPPVQMARELTKLEFSMKQPPAPKPVSKAPDPIKPIGTGKTADSGLSDDIPIDEWMRRRNKQLRR